MSQVGEEETSNKIRNMIFIMDSMTTKELESDGRMFIKEPSRIVRIARGSGCSVVEVEMILQQHRMMSSTAKSAIAAQAQGGQPGGPFAGNSQMQRMMQNAQSNPNFMQQAMSMLGGGAGAGGGAGGGPGGLAGMMNNPAMMQQAQQMMRSNPQMMQQAQEMMKNPQMMQRMMQQFGGMGGM